MAMKLTMGHLASLQGQAERLRTRYAHAIEKAHGIVHTVVRTSEVSAAAFGLGVFQGKMPGRNTVLGVPVDLGSALVLHVLGFAGIGGDYSGHLHNFGDGALASYLTKVGTSVGADWRQKALSAKVQGELGEGSTGAQSLSDAELAAVSRNS